MVGKITRAASFVGILVLSFWVFAMAEKPLPEGPAAEVSSEKQSVVTGEVSKDSAQKERVKRSSAKKIPSRKGATGQKKSTAKKTTKTKKAPAKPRDTGQYAKVKVDGAAVYQVANFDSPVLAYLDREQKIFMSKKLYPGIGGLGAFYKVRLKKGVYGYIVDTDVELSSAQKDGGRSDEGGEKDGIVDPLRLQSDLMTGGGGDPEGGDSFYLTRYLGLAYYNYNYVEVIRNVTEESPVSMLGMKMSGPTGFMGGIPLDINVLFTSSAPEFYSEVSSSTSGFMLIGDALVMLPLYEKRSFIAYYGFGPLIRYSKWDVKIKNSTFEALDSQEVGFGAAFTLGAAVDLNSLVRLGRSVVLRADSRYYYEKEKYFGFGAALQLKY